MFMLGARTGYFQGIDEGKRQESERISGIQSQAQGLVPLQNQVQTQEGSSAVRHDMNVQDTR